MSDSLIVGRTLCKIIQTQMGLGADQVWMYDQKRDIPPETKLWIVVRFLIGRPFGNVSKSVDGTEFQTLYMNSVFVIDIKSRDNSALARKEEILLALGSQYAQRQQELYAFKIGKLSVAFNDLSIIEGPAIPYRFSANFQVQYKTELQRTVDYYDSFSDSITTEA